MTWAGPATSDRQFQSLFPIRSTTDPDDACSVGILSTYPSMHRGVATFAASLAEALVAAGAPWKSVGVVRLRSAQAFSSHPHDDAHRLPPGVAADSREAALTGISAQRLTFHMCELADRCLQVRSAVRRCEVPPGKAIWIGPLRAGPGISH